MTDPLEEMAKEITNRYWWRKMNDQTAGELESDVLKALRTLRSKTRKEDALIAEGKQFMSDYPYDIETCNRIAQAILKK